MKERRLPAFSSIASVRRTAVHERQRNMPPTGLPGKQLERPEDETAPGRGAPKGRCYCAAHLCPTAKRPKDCAKFAFGDSERNVIERLNRSGKRTAGLPDIAQLQKK